MEGALQDIQSASLEKPSVQIVLKKLEHVIENAKDMRDGAIYQNTNLRRGLEIVQEFLRKTHRICYGGMAINAHLPESQKFYDFSKVLPDYDFFTPSQDEDIRRLVKELRKEGLPNVEVKFGIHKGTVKIFVDFNSIADITAVTPSFYSVLLKDSIIEHGIHYAGANFLRMAMYLELSRPMGEVERWDKVYKRLYLLNTYVPISSSGCEKHKLNTLTSAERNNLIHFAVQNSLVYCTPDAQGLYKSPEKTSTAWLTKSRAPMIVYSANPYNDAKAIKSIVFQNRTELRIYRWEPEDEFIPRLIGVVENGAVLCLLVEQSACHAYNSIELKNGSVLRVASLDTLIALYYSLDFVHGLRGLSRTGFSCLANTFVGISHKTRDSGAPGRFPEFPLTCTGHQPSKETLLKAKQLRIEEFREQKKKKKKSMTRKLGKKS